MRIMTCCLVIFLATGCVGTVVGTAADIVIETAKIPFKVGKAVIDIASDDDSNESDSGSASDDSRS